VVRVATLVKVVKVCGELLPLSLLSKVAGEQEKPGLETMVEVKSRRVGRRAQPVSARTYTADAALPCLLPTAFGVLSINATTDRKITRR